METRHWLLRPLPDPMLRQYSLRRLHCQVVPYTVIRAFRIEVLLQVLARQC